MCGCCAAFCRAPHGARGRGGADRERPSRRRAGGAARQRAALPRLPEPVHRRLERGPGGGSAPPDPRADHRRQERRRDRGLHGGALRRLRALPASVQGDHPAAVARPGIARRRRVRGSRAATARAAPARTAGADSRRARAGGAPAPARAGRTVVTLFMAIAAATVVAAAIPIGALALYLAIGTPAALSPGAEPQHEMTRKRVEQMVARLAARLEKAPEDPEGWRVLGRAYAVLGRHPEAARAYERAAKAPDAAASGRVAGRGRPAQGLAARAAAAHTVFPFAPGAGG